LERFRNDPLRDEMVALRLWDDAAKVPDIEAVTPRARGYLDLVVEHLEGEGSGSL
jgi:predicted HD phosphohydrolase